MAKPLSPGALQQGLSKFREVRADYVKFAKEVSEGIEKVARPAGLRPIVQVDVLSLDRYAEMLEERKAPPTKKSGTGEGHICRLRVVVPTLTEVDILRVRLF